LIFSPLVLHPSAHESHGTPLLLPYRTTIARCPQGVGRKVADCVALFSLDKCDAIPVDTHVWDIACRDYDRSLASAKSLTPTVYNAVGDLFRARFGAKAGWAHSLLFAAELPEFRSTLPEDIQNKMKRYNEDRRSAKKQRQMEVRLRKERKASSSEPVPSISKEDAAYAEAQERDDLGAETGVVGHPIDGDIANNHKSVYEGIGSNGIGLSTENPKRIKRKRKSI